MSPIIIEAGREWRCRRCSRHFLGSGHHRCTRVFVSGGRPWKIYDVSLPSFVRRLVRGR